MEFTFGLTSKVNSPEKLFHGSYCLQENNVFCGFRNFHGIHLQPNVFHDQTQQKRDKIHFIALKILLHLQNIQQAKATEYSFLQKLIERNFDKQNLESILSFYPLPPNVHWAFCLKELIRVWPLSKSSC